MKKFSPHMFSKGFGLVELLVGIALFTVIALGAYQAFTTVFQTAALSKEKTLALSLANEQIEIVRNMPYGDIGNPGGFVEGDIPQTKNITRDGVNFTVTTIVRGIDRNFDGVVGGSPNDANPRDNKLVAVEVSCDNCQHFESTEITTHVAPQGLEGTANAGALFIDVFDANGDPVSDATIDITNNKVNPVIDATDTTNTDGELNIVSAPTSTEGYNIIASKSGYSTSRTYGPDAFLPSTPLKTDATVTLGRVTGISFIIDKLSTLNVKSQTKTCAPVGGVNFSLTGSKLVAENPSVVKYSQSHKTDTAGQLTLNDIEWDTYRIADEDATYDISGITPLRPFSVTPNQTKSVELTTEPADPNALLVAVQDRGSGNPVSDAEVTVSNPSSGYSVTKITNKGFLIQNDWSGGSGQNQFNDSTQYYSGTQIDNQDPAGEIRLGKQASREYYADGVLESSTFDTGGQSFFKSIKWEPFGQPSSAGDDSVRFQVATNGTTTGTTTWNFVGPDGTENSYYSEENTDISSVHDNDRYIRYKMYLKTKNTRVTHSNNRPHTPVISNVSITYASSCTPPGQVIFQGLSGARYDITVTKDGYQDAGMSATTTEDWQYQKVILNPR